MLKQSNLLLVTGWMFSTSCFFLRGTDLLQGWIQVKLIG